MSDENDSQQRGELEKGQEGQVVFDKVRPSPPLLTESGIFIGTGWGVCADDWFVTKAKTPLKGGHNSVENQSRKDRYM